MPKRKPKRAPMRTLDQIIAESARLEEQAAAQHEKMIKLSRQLDANRDANAVERARR